MKNYFIWLFITCMLFSCNNNKKNSIDTFYQNVEKSIQNTDKQEPILLGLNFNMSYEDAYRQLLTISNTSLIFPKKVDYNDFCKEHNTEECNKYFEENVVGSHIFYKIVSPSNSETFVFGELHLVNLLVGLKNIYLSFDNKENDPSLVLLPLLENKYGHALYESTDGNIKKWINKHTIIQLEREDDEVFLSYSEAEDELSNYKENQIETKEIQEQNKNDL